MSGCRREGRQNERAALQAGKGWWELNTPANVSTVSTVQQFKDIMNPIKGTDALVVVDFFAPWCRACRSLYPKIIQTASYFPEVRGRSTKRAQQGIPAVTDGRAHLFVLFTIVIIHVFICIYRFSL